jgi:energy-coupling factor transporter transmembrane protein EcfT
VVCFATNASPLTGIADALPMNTLELSTAATANAAIFRLRIAILLSCSSCVIARQAEESSIDAVAKLKMPFGCC